MKRTPKFPRKAKKMSKPYLPTLLLLLLLLPLAVIFFPVKLLAQWIPIMVLGIAMYFTKTKWFDQWRIRRKLELQGIRGPKPGFLYGNAREMKKIQASLMMEKKSSSVKNGEFVAHDYTSTLFPYFEQWRKEYGSIYTYSAGNKQHLYVNHPDLVKEMNYSMSWDLGKPSYVSKKYAPMLGNGVLRSNGHTWAHQRKIIAPEFFMDKVKGMTGLMLEAAEEVASKWERCIEAEDSVVKMAEINVQYDLRSAAADVISKTCFGSSYLKGKEIFSKLRTLQNLLCEQGTIFSSPALGLFSFGGQKKIDHLEEEVDSLIWNVVKERERACHQEENKDLLQLIMEGAMNSNMSTEDSSRRFIIDNCKNIYFAGHETTAITASWCLMLLALYPQWQEQIRAEVAQVCATTGSLDGDSIHKLKTVTMVIHEVLRLYPPAAFVSREALQETQIGHIVVPKGVCLWTLIPTLHRDPDIWGPNVNEFNPERFANGISNACKLPQVYIPFGVGPRLCLGKNFALVQLKIMVAHIISKFTFSLSPKYRHSPVYRMIVEPAQGVQLLVKKKPNS